MIPSGYELGSEILCNKCSPPNHKYDCGFPLNGQFKCECCTDEKCHCCHICKYLTTTPLDWKVFNGFSLRAKRRIRTTGKFEHDTCKKCNKPVVHDYDNALLGEEFEKTIFLDGCSDSDSTISRSSGGSYDTEEAEQENAKRPALLFDADGLPDDSISAHIEYPYVRIFNISIRQLHKLVTRRVQKIMRRAVPEALSKRRERLALERGRELNSEEVNDLWEWYIRREM
jgi:hypothetical protein